MLRRRLDDPGDIVRRARIQDGTRQTRRTMCGCDNIRSGSLFHGNTGKPARATGWLTPFVVAMRDQGIPALVHLLGGQPRLDLFKGFVEAFLCRRRVLRRRCARRLAGALDSAESISDAAGQRRKENQGQVGPLLLALRWPLPLCARASGCWAGGSRSSRERVGRRGRGIRARLAHKQSRPWGGTQGRYSPWQHLALRYKLIRKERRREQLAFGRFPARFSPVDHSSVGKVGFFPSRTILQPQTTAGLLQPTL